MSFKNIPKEVWEDLTYQIDLHGLDFADNFRAYRFSDGLHFEDYVEAAESGCCGIYEGSTIINGERWIIGCNYGH